MTQLYVPPVTRALADAASAEARRLQSAVAGGFSTEAGLEHGEAAAMRLVMTAKEAVLHFRQLRGQARRAGAKAQAVNAQAI